MWPSLNFGDINHCRPDRFSVFSHESIGSPKEAHQASNISPAVENDSRIYVISWPIYVVDVGSLLNPL